jgi:hypothetical protein
LWHFPSDDSWYYEDDAGDWDLRVGQLDGWGVRAKSILLKDVDIGALFVGDEQVSTTPLALASIELTDVYVELIAKKDLRVKTGADYDDDDDEHNIAIGEIQLNHFDSTANVARHFTMGGYRLGTMMQKKPREFRKIILKGYKSFNPKFESFSLKDKFGEIIRGRIREALGGLNGTIPDEAAGALQTIREYLCARLSYDTPTCNSKTGQDLLADVSLPLVQAIIDDDEFAEKAQSLCLQLGLTGLECTGDKAARLQAIVRKAAELFMSGVAA